MRKILPKNGMQWRNAEERERPPRDYSTTRFAEQDEDEFLSVDPKRKSKERAAGSEKTIGRQVRRACCGEAG